MNQVRTLDFTTKSFSFTIFLFKILNQLLKIQICNLNVNSDNTYLWALCVGMRSIFEFTRLIVQWRCDVEDMDNLRFPATSEARNRALILFLSGSPYRCQRSVAIRTDSAPIADCAVVPNWENPTKINSYVFPKIFPNKFQKIHLISISG